MKKLLIVTTTYKTQTSFLLPFARHFRSRGWKVDGLSHGISTSDECREAFDRVWDIEWSRNPLLPGNLLQAPRRVRQIFQEEQYDLVHVHTPVASFVTRLALRRFRPAVRVVYTAHGFHFFPGGNPLRNIVFRNLERLAGAWTDYLVVMNEDDRRSAERYGIVPSERIRYMPGIGIDLEEYRRGADPADGERLRREMKVAPEEVLFLMIAEFIPRKRHEDVLKAFARLLPGEARLVLAGDGPTEPAMKRMAQRLGIDGRVHFLGFRRDISALIRAADAVLLPSRQEGLPRSLMEAFCLGRPCIGSDIRGNRDLIGPECGFLVPVGDSAGIARAMEWMIAHPEERKQMGEAGRRKVEAYDVRGIIRMHDDLYDEAIKESSDARLSLQEVF